MQQCRVKLLAGKVCAGLSHWGMQESRSPGAAFKTSCQQSPTWRRTPSCTCWSFPGAGGIHSRPAWLPSPSWPCSACRRAGSRTWSCESCKDTAPGSAISRSVHSLHPATNTLHQARWPFHSEQTISADRSFSSCRIADTVFLGFPEDSHSLKILRFLTIFQMRKTWMEIWHRLYKCYLP